MARIQGVDIPDNKRGEISLTYIYGIGRRRAQFILTKAGVNWDKKAKDWNDEEANAIRNAIARASQTVKHLDWFEVTETRGHTRRLRRRRHPHQLILTRPWARR